MRRDRSGEEPSSHPAAEHVLVSTQSLLARGIALSLFDTDPSSRLLAVRTRHAYRCVGMYAQERRFDLVNVCDLGGGCGVGGDGVIEDTAFPWMKAFMMRRERSHKDACEHVAMLSIPPDNIL